MTKTQSRALVALMLILFIANLVGLLVNINQRDFSDLIGNVGMMGFAVCVLMWIKGRAR